MDNWDRGQPVGNPAFYNYFHTQIDYPNPTKEFLGIDAESGDDILLNYISNSFLSGWINYVQIEQVRIMHRYSEESPQELINKYLEKNDPPYHIKFLKFEDDVAILARDTCGRWWYFYYDQDVSDCSVGRFKTTDKDDVVIENFEKAHPESEIFKMPTTPGWLS